jgi:HK97 gp10 family phage protein
MAKFDFQIPDDFIKQLGRLADVDRIAPQMLNEALPILERNVKSEVSKHVVSGDLLKSIKMSKAKKNKYGYYASVRPTGTDKKGVRNMEKMVYLEYGTSKQASKPTLTKAIKDSEKAVLDKMQEVFNREVGE